MQVPRFSLATVLRGLPKAELIYKGFEASHCSG
jgi:hypothetical protein